MLEPSFNENKTKQQMMAAYSSQADFLMTFSSMCERFRPLAADRYDAEIRLIRVDLNRRVSPKIPPYASRPTQVGNGVIRIVLDGNSNALHGLLPVLFGSANRLAQAARNP